MFPTCCCCLKILPGPMWSTCVNSLKHPPSSLLLHNLLPFLLYLLLLFPLLSQILAWFTLGQNALIWSESVQDQNGASQASVDQGQWNQAGNGRQLSSQCISDPPWPRVHRNAGLKIGFRPDGGKGIWSQFRPVRYSWKAEVKGPIWVHGEESG